jgi:predicted LPLAT superfamily acyltransferase
MASKKKVLTAQLVLLLNEQMIKLYYNFITFFSRIFGYRFFALFSRFVSTAYFILFPRRVGASVHFYRALFPDKGWLHHILLAWRQFHSFTNVFLDRFLLLHGGNITYESEGWEVLESVVKEGRGGVIVMSHAGNWDVAAHLLRRRGLNLLLYMGARQKEQVERIQKLHLSEKGFNVLSVDQEGGSPFDILEGLNFLRKGGIVSLAGDRVWSGSQRTVQVSFLGRRVRLPEAPHAIALASGAPLLIFFAFRTGRGTYRISISTPVRVTASSRRDRVEAVRRSAQRYADILAEKARLYPLQWYHFEEFFENGG